MTSRRTTPPFRADHVGSLLRPTELLRARDDREEELISSEALREVEDRAIRRAVAMQEDVGLQSATDGELRRTSWHMDFIARLGGIEETERRMAVPFRSESGTASFTATGIRVAGRLRVEDTIFGDDFSFVAAAATTAVPKLTIPSPSMVHYRVGAEGIDRDAYPDLDAFWADLAAAYAEEIRRLGALGCTYLQLDDTSLAYLNDPAQRAMLAARGDDPDTQHRRYVEVINAAVADRPDGMTITTHSCRGNFRSHWAAEGGYDFVAEEVFSGLDVDGLFLEYDDARSGDFTPLRFVPPGKMVVLGLVTTKRPALESAEDLKRRIDEAARHLPLEQLCLSPQCGFSSTVEGNALTLDEQRAKLARVVEVAADVWG